MNIQEFAALKVGDQIENHLSHSSGTITEVNARGVHVRWGLQAGNIVTFFYSVQSTAWFHWSKAEEPSADDLERHEGDLEDRAR